MRRLFVALRPPDRLCQQLLAIQGLVSGARWQTGPQLHVTLAFLDDVAEDVAERVDAALAMIDAPPVALTLTGVGSFASRGRIHSLWAGAGPDDALARLAAKVRRAARLAGVAIEERAFVPHVTLARLNAASGPVDAFLAQWSDFSAGPETVTRFGLYESLLGSGGSAYHCLADYPLRG